MQKGPQSFRATIRGLVLKGNHSMCIQLLKSPPFSVVLLQTQSDSGARILGISDIVLVITTGVLLGPESCRQVGCAWQLHVEMDLPKLVSCCTSSRKVSSFEAHRTCAPPHDDAAYPH